MKKLKLFLRSLAFLLVLVTAVLVIQQPFRIQDSRIRQTLDGFYCEEEGALDAVYVGSSDVYAFFEAPLAWERYGIAVYPYSIPSMPGAAVKHVIMEARKTQPDALYIVNVNLFRTLELDETIIHRMVDYMPLSRNKLDLIDALCDRAGISGTDRLEFYLPMIRFHSGWSGLTSVDFTNPYNGMKGAAAYWSFLNSVKDVSGAYADEQRVGEISPDIRRDLDDLLDYCVKEGVDLLFVTVPQARKARTSALATFNGVEAYVRDRGYFCVDLMHDLDITGIRPESDFYNERHMNLHGAMKFTEYLSRYLVEHYGLTDKRGMPGYESWDEAVRRYDAVIAPFALPFERTHEARDYSLSCGNVRATAAEGAVTVEWTRAEGADAYLIFRKSDDGGEKGWKLLLEAEPSAEGIETYGRKMWLEDVNVTGGVTYTYTVVPVRRTGGETVYGAFDHNGGSAAVPAGEGADAGEMQEGDLQT